jgi:hypothetical protein
LRLWSGKHRPVSLAHSAFNNLMAAAAGVAVATSPATMAYVTTETGVVTMIIMVLVAGYLLTRRAADFAQSRAEVPAADQRTTSRCTTGTRERATLDPLLGAPAGMHP